MSDLNHVNDDTMSEYLKWVEDNDDGFEDGGDDDAEQVFLDEGEVNRASVFVEELLEDQGRVSLMDGTPVRLLGKMLVDSIPLPDAFASYKAVLPDGTTVRVEVEVQHVSYVHVDYHTSIFDADGNEIGASSWEEEW